MFLHVTAHTRYLRSSIPYCWHRPWKCVWFSIVFLRIVSRIRVSSLFSKTHIPTLPNYRQRIRSKRILCFWDKSEIIVLLVNFQNCPKFVKKHDFLNFSVNFVKNQQNPYKQRDWIKNLKKSKTVFSIRKCAKKCKNRPKNTLISDTMDRILT